MSSRAALALALIVVVSLLAFGAALLNVPLPAVYGGAALASAIILWRVGRVRRPKTASTIGGGQD